jgi:hypothetical protein
MDMDQDFGLDDDMDETQDSTSAPVQAKKEPVERKRKRRTVKKSKMEMDDKGYMGGWLSILVIRRSARPGDGYKG